MWLTTCSAPFKSFTGRLRHCFPSRIIHLPKENRCLSDSANLLGTNTNVVKDVILYRSDNPKFYRYLNLFGISQFFFWGYLGQWSYSSMRDAPVNEVDITDDTPWYKKINLGENKYKNSLTFLCFATGYIMLTGAWALTLRSVRFLILRKGGKSVSIITYAPFGKTRTMEVPVKNVSAADSRQTARVNLPLKIKGKWLHYMCDMRGEFRNAQLFDATVGLRRTL